MYHQVNPEVLFVTDIRAGLSELRRTSTGNAEQSFRSTIAIGGGKCVAPLDPLSPLGADIYRRSSIQNVRCW